jgi:dTDP-4-dehydrorhamnose reductase
METLILGKGYVGTHLYNHFKGSADIMSKSELNYHDEETLYNFLLDTDIKTVISTVGFTGKPNVDQCEEKKEECFKLNVIIPKIIENVCKALDINLIHISSGCIYTGYDKIYTEEDTPNFGFYDKSSSFYSNTKHLSELILDPSYTNIIRIRMPVEGKLTDKNLLTKLLKYDSIIDYANSKTDLKRLCEFVETVKDNFKSGIYNAVHSNALTTREVVKILKEYNLVNENWKFVPYEVLKIKANRSNCVLSNEKALRDFNFDFGDEEYYIKLNASLIEREEGWKEK